MELVTVEELASRLEAGAGAEPRLVVSGNCAAPLALLHSLTETLPSCRLFSLNAPAGWPQRDRLINETPFVGPGTRGDPLLDYLPMRLSLVPRLFGSSRPPDAVLLHTSRPRSRKVSMGIEVTILPAAVEAVRARGGLVIAQVNADMPYTYGDGEVPTDWIDFAVEMDEPLLTHAARPANDCEQQIGEQVAQLVEDGATLQLGIGEIPDDVAAHLRARQHLRVWSEMISDGTLSLERAGALDPGRPLVASFVIGSPELYRWVDANPRIRMRRTEVVNDPARIAAHPGMVSINTAMQVDLFAQVNAMFVRGRVHSGFGGQPDFVSGALHSEGGHAIVALRSWHDKSDTSTVLPVLRHPVTSFQHSMIVSEHGRAEIFGRGQRTQAALLIDHVADPRARDELHESIARFAEPEGAPVE
jgi:acyl-CoA hydrolase